MLARVRQFLNRPLAEDFSLKTQFSLSMQAAVYVFIFVSLLNSPFNHFDRLYAIALLAVGVLASALLMNVLVPKLLPVVYDEERWTVGKHMLHTLFVLLVISVSNQLILAGLDADRPNFVQMYLYVTIIGFFPIMLGVFVAEKRRLKRNLAQVSTLNAQFDQLHVPVVPAAEPELPKSILLVSETGNERLSILPNQLLYVESVGNYVEVYWLNFMFPQKTVLRSTLKTVEAALADHSQFLRCHRAFIVNLKAINHTSGNARGYQLQVSGSDREIPVSRSYLAAFDERMAELV
ncbi:LytTR family transcriptional regulator [Spirosoma sp. KUDC1026]|nr:LytTR family transcriptional regulator [Spirosoma sp. KUDC1026]